MGFALQPAARSHPVQVAIDIELQQVDRRITRTPCCLCRYPREPCRRQVQPVDEGVNEPNRVVGVDVSSTAPPRQEQQSDCAPIRQCESCAILAHAPARRNPLTPTILTVCKNSAGRFSERPGECAGVTQLVNTPKLGQIFWRADAEKAFKPLPPNVSPAPR